MTFADVFDGPLSGRRTLRPQCHNFSGGPGALASSVLEEAAGAVRLFEDTGDSILGLSHRSGRFKAMVDGTEAALLALIGAPPGYRVLFLQGGGSLQFSMIPMHLLRGASGSAEYIASGYWSAKAIPEAAHEGRVRVLWSGEKDGFRRTPRRDELEPSKDAAYLHYVSNETVEGLRFPYVPGHDDVPRVCDMSSDFLSEPFDLSRYDLVYAHAQKNLGPAGVTVVILRDWILERGAELPAVLRYRTHADHGSIFNTPPVFAIYVASLDEGRQRREGGAPLRSARRASGRVRASRRDLEPLADERVVPAPQQDAGARVDRERGARGLPRHRRSSQPGRAAGVAIQRGDARVGKRPLRISEGMAPLTFR